MKVAYFMGYVTCDVLMRGGWGGGWGVGVLCGVRGFWLSIKLQISWLSGLESGCPAL